ncbi:hypothetical protein NX720_04695 [Endozoicomonas euniceicola]|uniref:Uncharacterized protein n=1 Tax=Endozoicomonas euniceicola TaxID=1234143 RepID=A0ABY6H161_9GAMM|nr:hypothetical protein NX720_04695 [Endozoicomonas euniceicola]
MCYACMQAMGMAVSGDLPILLSLTGKIG